MERRLYRSTTDRMFSGVCGGFAEYVGVDSTLIRLGVAALGLMSCGTVLLFYIVAVIIIPEPPRGYNSRQYSSEEQTTRRPVNREEADDLYETSAKPSTKPSAESNEDEPLE